MNEHLARRKGFRHLVATLRGLALFLSLFALAPVGSAVAQYIPPPASQTYAPAQGVTTSTPEEPRATRSTRSRKASARSRKREAETVVAEEPAPAKARHSTRRSRAEARAAARQARAEARAEARAAAAAKKKSRSTRAVATQDDADETPASQAQDKIVILAGQPQTTVARGAEELAELAKSAGLDAEAKTGPISLSQLNGPDAEGADLAILQSDALDDARRDAGVGAGLQRKLTFIARLFNQEIHILARPGVKTFADLDGRAIASSAPDTPEGRTAAKLFERAGIHPRLLEMDAETAFARLGRGEIDAAIFVGGKPVPALTGMSIAGLHLISIPYKGALQDFYYPAQITKADYPDLVKSDKGVDTVAIGTVLVALEAKPGSARSKKLTQFTQIFFERFGALRDSAHHPKWREVNLAADVPGWRRFQPAQKWLDNAPAPRVSSMK